MFGRGPAEIVTGGTVGALLAPPARQRCRGGHPVGREQIIPWHLQSHRDNTDRPLNLGGRSSTGHSRQEHCTWQPLANGPAGQAGWRAGRTCHPLCPDPKRRLSLGHGG
jgi:hypothetical protein